MPKTRRNRKGRKRYKKKRWSYSITSPPAGISPLPLSFKTTLRYCDTDVLNPGAGTIDTDTYGANCLWDPFLGAGGHQPRGWDELIALYNHCTVIGSRIAVQWANEDPNNSMVVGIALRAGTNTETSINDYIEQGNCTYSILGSRDGGGEVKTSHYKFNNKFLGISHPMSETALRNNISSNPSELATYQLFAGSPVGTDTSPCQYQLTIEYRVVFTEPKAVIQS